MPPEQVGRRRPTLRIKPIKLLKVLETAIELGADMVEVDVHSTRDAQLVVIHDDTVNRTTNGEGAVREMTLEEIRRLDAGKGEKIPTLQEALKLSENKVGVVIGVKGVGTEKLLVDLLESEDAVKNVVVTSFMADAIRKVKELNQQIPTGQIFS